MKSIWSGTISFGLVQIPVQLLSAIQAHTFGFHMLHDECNTQLAYERWCPRCKEKVTWQHTVKGLPGSDGTVYVFAQEKIAELKPEKTDAIDVLYFVDRLEIPDIYLDSHFYIAPDKKSSKSFFLFLEALDQTGLVAVGRFVMRDKEYMCAIEPYDHGMLLTTLNYEYEIRSMDEIASLKKAPAVTKSEVTLAKQLIAKMTKKKFDISKYKDTFIEKLKKTLKTKKPTRPAPPTKAKSKPPTEAVQKPKKDDLITALRSSLRTPAQERAAARASSGKTQLRKTTKSKTKPTLKAARSTVRKTKKKKS